MLSLNRLKQAQRDYRFFVAFNVVSFSFMTGNIIFLYAMRLGAGTRLIGFLSALGSITFIFSLLGRRIIRYLGIVKTRGYFWLGRYLIMIPVLITLIPSVRGNALLSLTIVTGGYLGFNMLKGIALAAAKPILGYISRAADRAAFVAGNNSITFIGQIVTGLTMAFLLGEESPLYMYGLFIAAGISAGVVASRFSLKLPEPESESPVAEVSLLGSVREAVKRPEFSRLVLLVMLSNIAIGMAMGFIVVYAKTVYAQPDNLVVFFTVAGAVGALGMAGLSRFLTDRIGSKPMYFLFNGLRILILIPVIWAPRFEDPRSSLLFLLGVFFMHQMTTWGIHSTADLYFFATTKAKDRVDLGIVFNITRGLFGMIGSLGGGFLLGWLQGIYGPGDLLTPFRIHFAISALFLLANLPLIARLPDVSDYSIIDLLSIIFSPRDLKAIYYLNKLEKSSSSEEERTIISAMGSNRSPISEGELKRRLESPDFFVRMEALNGLKSLPGDLETVQLLIEEIRNHPYTTAHVAARALADCLNGSTALADKLHREAIAVLREALDSEDYLLKSKAALSLAELGEDEAEERILEILENTENPREIIYTVKALETLRSSTALPTILSRIGTSAYPYLADDLTLSAAGILGMGEWFYPHFMGFRQKPKRGLSSLKQAVDDEKFAAMLDPLFSNFGEDHFGREYRESLTSECDPVMKHLAAGLNGYADHPSVRFLALGYLVFQEVMVKRDPASRS